MFIMIRNREEEDVSDHSNFAEEEDEEEFEYEYGIREDILKELEEVRRMVENSEELEIEGKKPKTLHNVWGLLKVPKRCPSLHRLGRERGRT